MFQTYFVSTKAKGWWLLTFCAPTWKENVPFPITTSITLQSTPHLWNLTFFGIISKQWSLHSYFLKTFFSLGIFGKIFTWISIGTKSILFVPLISKNMSYIIPFWKSGLAIAYWRIVFIHGCSTIWIFKYFTFLNQILHYAQCQMGNKIPRDIHLVL